MITWQWPEHHIHNAEFDFSITSNDLCNDFNTNISCLVDPTAYGHYVRVAWGYSTINDGVFAIAYSPCTLVATTMNFNSLFIPDGSESDLVSLENYLDSGCTVTNAFYPVSQLPSFYHFKELELANTDPQIVQNPTQDIALGVFLLMLVCFVTVISLYKRSGHK